MLKETRKTIFVLEMQPNSARAANVGIVRICESPFLSGRCSEELELNREIARSESGKRDLVPLHRLRAERVYSNSCMSLKSTGEILACIYAKLGDELDIPKGGFFDVSREKAIEAIETVFLEHEQKLVSDKKKAEKKKKRQAGAEKRRQELRARKRKLKPIIDDVVNNSASHPKELCDILDGLDGKALQSWAEKQLSQAKKARRKLRELTIERAKGVQFDIVTLREIQRQLESWNAYEICLTESEEYEYDDLKQDAMAFYEIVKEWCDELPCELSEFGAELQEIVEEYCPLAGSFEDLVRDILFNKSSQGQHYL